MGKFLVRKVSYEETDVSENDLMTLKEAAEVLGLTFPGVVRAIERGQLTEYVDSTVSGIARKNRRYVLRSQVEEWNAHRRS